MFFITKKKNIINWLNNGLVIKRFLGDIECCHCSLRIGKGDIAISPPHFPVTRSVKKIKEDLVRPNETFAQPQFVFEVLKWWGVILNFVWGGLNYNLGRGFLFVLGRF